MIIGAIIAPAVTGAAARIVNSAMQCRHSRCVLNQLHPSRRYEGFLSTTFLASSASCARSRSSDGTSITSSADVGVSDAGVAEADLAEAVRAGADLVAVGPGCGGLADEGFGAGLKLGVLELIPVSAGLRGMACGGRAQSLTWSIQRW